MGLTKVQKAALDQYLAFISTPLPEREEEWLRLESQVVRLYKKSDWVVPPLPQGEERREWVKDLWHQARTIVQKCYNNIIAQKTGRTTSVPYLVSRITISTTSGTISRSPSTDPAGEDHTISLPYKAGTIHLEVRNSRLIPIYRHYEDPSSTFLLTLVNLLTWLDDLSKIQRCICGNWFYKIRRQEYCSKECKEKAHPSKERTKDYRVRRAAWESAQADLEQAVKRSRSLYKTTGSQALEHLEKVFKKAQQAFDKAFPLNKGQGCEEGRKLLARAREQIGQLRKKVKGY